MLEEGCCAVGILREMCRTIGCPTKIKSSRCSTRLVVVKGSSMKSKFREKRILRQKCFTKRTSDGQNLYIRKTLREIKFCEKEFQRKGRVTKKMFNIGRNVKQNTKFNKIPRLHISYIILVNIYYLVKG